MPQIKIGIALFSLFIFVVAYKISTLDKFMRDLKKIANDFRMDPDQAQEDCDKLMMKDDSGRSIFNDPSRDEQQGLHDVKELKDKAKFIPDRLSSVENLAEIVSDPDFNSHCLTLTCLNVLLEVFGHVFISLCSSLGYILYNLDRKFLLLLLHFSQWSDAGGLFCGSYFGKTKFANAISPKKTVQGVIGAIILPMVISLFFWTIQYHTEFDFFINMDI